VLLKTIGVYSCTQTQTQKKKKHTIL